MGKSSFDTNFRNTAIGVDHINYTTPTEPAVNSSTHAWLVEGQETSPVDASKTNPSGVIGYDAFDNLTTITKTIGANSYQKTYSWTDGKLVSWTSWVQI